MYLTKRNGVYQYQRRIPETSQPFFNKKVFKHLLGTKDKQEAIVLARQLATEDDIRFKEHEALEAQTKALQQPENHSYQVNLAEKQTQLLKLKELATYGSEQWIANQALQSNTLGGISARITDADAARTFFEPHLDLSERIIEGEISDYELALTREWKALLSFLE
ncbi:DUF6538 domain-containing protein [Vibrio sp. HN007]|uniref:DUF6538 domain-containing protein n=1 Tax=Vibrio iocasae TaxID=3098914 RepID=UPI0035D4BB20